MMMTLPEVEETMREWFVEKNPRFWLIQDKLETLLDTEV